MQTFLPYPDFNDSLCVLDYRRLGKQRVEALQILNTLTGRSSGWKNHPAVRMWRGYERALICYGRMAINRWTSLGYKNSMSFDEIATSLPPGSWSVPPWFGDEKIHLSHRSNLLRKLPEHYRQFWPHDPDDLPYIWPV